jgi:hypothetical protein
MGGYHRKAFSEKSFNAARISGFTFSRGQPPDLSAYIFSYLSAPFPATTRSIAGWIMGV